jgi:hypothetical protein
LHVSHILIQDLASIIKVKPFRYIYVYMYTCMYIYKPMYVYIYIYIYICIYVWHTSIVKKIWHQLLKTNRLGMYIYIHITYKYIYMYIYIQLWCVRYAILCWCRYRFQRKYQIEWWAESCCYIRYIYIYMIYIIYMSNLYKNIYLG